MTASRFGSKKITQKIALTLLFAAAALFLAAPAGAVVSPGAKFSGGNLTLEAKNATVGELLQVISRTAGVDIFVSRGFEAGQEKRTLKIDGAPLEDVLRSLLRGYNYAAIYVKEGNDFRMAAVKIYTEGQQGKEVVPLFSGGGAPVQIYEEKNRRGEAITVMVSSGGNIATRGSVAAGKGVVGPSQMEIAGNPVTEADLKSPWFAFQLQAEQDEVDRFSELLLLRKQSESTTDPQRKQALALVYADEVAKFQDFRKANLNKVEALKRISQFKEITKQ